MSFMQKLVIGALTLLTGIGWAQTSTQKSQIGYLYPGGAQQGATVLCHSGKPAKSKKSLRRRFFGGGGRSDCSADLRGLTLA